LRADDYPLQSNWLSPRATLGRLIKGILFLGIRPRHKMNLFHTRLQTPPPQMVQRSFTGSLPHNPPFCTKQNPTPPSCPRSLHRHLGSPFVSESHLHLCLVNVEIVSHLHIRCLNGCNVMKYPGPWVEFAVARNLSAEEYSL